MISDEYREMNKQLHEDKPSYGISGGKHAPFIVEMCKQSKSKTVLDYGCGKGQLKEVITNSTPFLTVYEYDPAIEGKDSPPQPQDVVYCGDVLEHIEPEYIDEVLEDINRCSKVMSILYIDTAPAQKTLSDGRNAHLIQEKMPWWFNKVSEHMEVVMCQYNKANKILMVCQ